jgi:hypothetical protein
MGPCHPLNNLIYSVMGNTHKLRNLSVRKLAGSGHDSYFNYRFFGELCGSDLGPDCLSSFGNHISRIFLRRTKKEMVRANARRIVAFMEHAKTFRYCSTMHFPRNAMSESDVTIMPNASIPLPCFKGKPNPASFSYLNFFKESLARWHRFIYTIVSSLFHAGYLAK